MVHPAMLSHPTGAKTVFIGGGGEFATAREVLYVIELPLTDSFTDSY